MKIKRIISVFLAVLLAFGCVMPSYAASTENPVAVSKTVRTIDGYIEMITRVLRSKLEGKKYGEYKELCDIPETENGYVPQGFCFSEAADCYFISYYHKTKASIISIVDAESGKKIKTVNIKKANGEDFTGHAGGIAEDGTFFYVCHGSRIYRLTLAELALAPDGGSIYLVNSILTDVKCSYINSDGEYLYAGEFYVYDADGGYDTDASHHMAVSLFERTYSRCNAYKLSDVSSDFANGQKEISVPDFVFTTPNSVQGIARLENGSFALATSFGRNNNSYLKIYSDVTKEDSDFELDYSGRKVPAYHLKKSDRTENRCVPPMLEGIDDANGKIAGIFESGAKTYSDSKFIVNKICEF